MLGYLDTEFVQIMDDTVALLRRVFGTENSLTLPVSGTGTAGMEAALANLIEPGDPVVVGINGYFGARIADIAARCRAVVTTVEAEWGKHIPTEKIAETVANVMLFLNALEKLLIESGHSAKRGTAVQAASQAYAA
jgi:alanine-glyoxylate transaminase/serine-glyoxylate transaminase/serine-pyruvate transaminase